jgi:hypothetical protein
MALDDKHWTFLDEGKTVWRSALHAEVHAPYDYETYSSYCQRISDLREGTLLSARQNVLFVVERPSLCGEKPCVARTRKCFST